MKAIPILLLALLFSNFTCIDQSQSKVEEDKGIEFNNTPTLDTIHNANSIEYRIAAPAGFSRLAVRKNSFAYFLRTLPLKADGANVKLYNGKNKVNQSAHVAVVDLNIGRKNLHQCADAIMRLRADYLRSVDRENDIKFNLTNGMPVEYSKWMNGNRIVLDGNQTFWKEVASPSSSDKSYWAYLEQIFMYAGTLSLSNELLSKNIAEIEIGDVFIQGGSPGHAVIVVDMIVDSRGENKKFLLAQSYMPAQEIHILKAPSQEDSPWYSLNNNPRIETPEWTFFSSDLKHF